MNNITRFFLYAITFCALMNACTSEEEPIGDKDTTTDYRQTPGRRTIIAYITADNNISSNLSSDITEMQEGTKTMPSDCRLIVFADVSNQKPYIANIHDGIIEKVKEYDNDFYSTSPDSMRSVLQWIIDNYPSEEYAAVLEGHGSGPLIRKDTIASNPIKAYAYGYDDTGETTATSTRKWMNIPSLAAVFNSLKDQNDNKIKMSYIFFDCCCFQTVEVAYELRHATDYIIAPVSETPGEGADYKMMVYALCTPKSEVANNIVNTYAANSTLCISAVKTSEMDNLCNATKEVLESIYKNAESPLVLNRYKCIYYYRGDETGTIRTPTLHDIKNIIKTNASESAYNKWLPYLERTVTAKKLAKSWETNMRINFYSFEDNMTDDYYGGISMIAPSDAYPYNGSDINETMFQLEWCRNVGWKEFGW